MPSQRAASQRRRLSWRLGLVGAAALAGGLLVGLIQGAGLGWRTAVLSAWAAGVAHLTWHRRGDGSTGRAQPHPERMRTEAWAWRDGDDAGLEQRAGEGPRMASKRHEGDRACRCHQGDAGCVALTVGRLSQQRVRELAEEIWTASDADGIPLRRATSDPRDSQAGASAQAAYQRCRQQEREAWRHGMLWRVGAVAAAALGGGLLIGISLGAWLGWRMAALAALLVWWRLRPHPSARARVWRREAAMQRRTAEVLEPLRQRGLLVLHDLTVPGWPASLDHLVIGSTGVWVIQSWRRPRFGRLRRASSPWTAGGGTAAQPPRLRWQAEAIAEVLPGDARIPVRPLLCVHGGGWLAGPLAVQDVRVARPREVPDIVRRGSRAHEDEVELAIARLLEVLHPAV
jgi:hypothetical protein